MKESFEYEIMSWNTQITVVSSMESTIGTVYTTMGNYC